MSYNLEELPHYVKTAGKISILTAVVSFCVFLFALMVDVGQQEFQRAAAQSSTATTTLTVVNTPPEFDNGPFELFESSTTTPTNSSDDVQWGAVATDANGAPYYLLICSTNATPTPVNSGSPLCGTGAIQWGVSTATVSGTLAIVSTTTVEFADSATTPFAESNDWFAFVCDGDPVQAACSPVTEPNIQGVAATNSSPFFMNQRPVLTNAATYGETDPGSLLTFFSTSTDLDSVGGQDTLSLIICSSNTNYDTVTNTCTDYIASTSVQVEDDVSASTTTAPVIRDQVYSAFAYLIDNHGHEASAPLPANFTIANVAPTILGGDILVNGGSDIILSNLGDETPGFSLSFTLRDANSCINSSGTTSSEFTQGANLSPVSVSLFRYPTYNSTTCDPANANYDPNFCYTNGVATTTWNISCTASSTSCTGITDDTQIFECDYPLWFVTDPTDAGPYAADVWISGVSGSDDDFATSTTATSTGNVEVQQLQGFELRTADIPYGALAPGENNPTLSASTTIANTGNTGIDQEVSGSAMCEPYVSSSTDCSLNATSTIFAPSQKYSSSSVAFNAAAAIQLATTSEGIGLVDLDIADSSATSSDAWATGVTYWGIGVPSAVTVAGAYTGQNAFDVTADTDAGW